MAFEDYYARLETHPQSSEEEIRSAYRRLVLQYHPDRNPENPDAEETFKQIGLAYKTLSNSEDRKRYDVRHQAFQDSQRLRRQNEQAETVEKTNRAVPFRARAASNEGATAIEYGFDVPILQQKDAINGAAAGAFFALLLGTVYAQRAQLLSLPITLAWTSLVFPAALLGQQAGALFREIFEAWFESLPTWLEDTPQALPTVGSLLAIVGVLILYSYFHVPVFTGGSLAAAMGATLAGLFGSSFGRAVLSVATSASGKLFGYVVAGTIGAILGLMLSPILVLIGHGLTFNSAFYDFLFAGGAGGFVGGATASWWGARRRTAGAL